MTEIKLTKRYPLSRTEDITDAYMRGWNDALDAVQNGKFHIADTPQTETQTETQNSNLTFEKRTMRDCYNCKKFETEDECIECHYEPKDEPKLEGIWNAGYKTGYDKGYKDAQKVKDSQDLVKDLVKAFCEDGTWLERQGVYTLTLAEAKQRAVDIIESVTQTETQNSNLTFEKADERCKGCNHYKLTCDLFSEICRFEPKDEPQTDVYDYKGNGKWEQTDCPWK